MDPVDLGIERRSHVLDGNTCASFIVPDAQPHRVAGLSLLSLDAQPQPTRVMGPAGRRRYRFGVGVGCEVTIHLIGR